MIWALLAAAFAGDLMVLTATPVVVKVDGTPIEYTPGTMVVQVAGIDGIHKVEVVSVTGESKALMNVSIPKEGGVSMAWDGMNLVMAAAGTTSATSSTSTVSITTGVAEKPVKKAPTAMSDSSLTALLAAVDKASFADDKLDVVQTAAKSNWFTIAQVGRLIDAMDFGDGRLGVVRACKDRVVDPANAFQLGEHFDFSSEREEALGMFK